MPKLMISDSPPEYTLLPEGRRPPTMCVYDRAALVHWQMKG